MAQTHRDTHIHTDSCSNPFNSMYSALTAACKCRERRRRSRQQRQRKRSMTQRRRRRRHRQRRRSRTQRNVRELCHGSNVLPSKRTTIYKSTTTRRRRTTIRRRRGTRTAEGEEEEEAYVSSVMGAMLCPANRHTWVWLMSWWCDSTGCTYRLGSQLWFMKRATLPSCFASRMYFACLWVSLTGKCSSVTINHLIRVFS